MNRRIFLRRLGAAALGASFAPHFLHALAAAQRKPNVIHIFTDDQGSMDVNCYGANDLDTPNMDRLAAPRRPLHPDSTPPRRSARPPAPALMTGRIPARAGVPRQRLLRPRATPACRPTEVTIAELLKAAGYATAHVGKWHLGYTPETMPNGQGFDHSFGHMGGCIDNYSHFFYWDGPNRHDLWRNGEEIWHDGQYFPDLMADQA